MTPQAPTLVTQPVAAERTCAVTGGARGLGFACAKALLAEVGQVAILDTDADTAGAAASELAELGARAEAIPCDVADGASVADAFAAVFDRFGDVHVLVNNAGVSAVERTEEVTEEEWDAVVDTSLKGTFLCSQQVARRLIASGAPGSIVNVASMLGVVQMPTRAAYASAKAGILAFTKVVAGEWATHGIRVNAVAPGYLMTEGMHDGIEDGEIDVGRLLRWVPQGRMGDPAEVARLVRFLASDEASFVTGATFVADGGYTAYGAWWEADVAGEAPFERRDDR